MSIKRFSVLILCLIMILSACLSFASGENIDTSEDQKKVDEYGIPSADYVKQLEETADKLWEAKDYTAAAQAYAQLSVQANWLANIIASIDEPYYSASSKDQDYFYNNSMSDLASRAEKYANSYKSIRNKAMAREGLCYYYLKDYQEAVPRLMKALDLIEITDTVNWKQCADAIIDIVGLTATLEADAAKEKAEAEARAKAEEEAKKAAEEAEAKAKAEAEARKAAEEKEAMLAEIAKQTEELYYMRNEIEKEIEEKAFYGEDTAELQASLADIEAQIDELSEKLKEIQSN